MPPRSATTKEMMYEIDQMVQRRTDRALAQEDPTQFTRDRYIYLFLKDPGAPFTETPTPEEIELGEHYDQLVAAAHSASLPAVVRAKEIGERITAKEAAKATVATDQDEQEDPYASLGGGHNTYQQQGFLPAGRVEDARTQVTRGRGGKLVTRITLAGKFIDVPIDEHNSNASSIEAAKEHLVHGKGTPTGRLRRRSSRENQQVS